MKISKDVIETFRIICKDEENTSDKDVEFKITRNFHLAPVTKVLAEDTYIKQLGTLYMLYSKGKIISLFRGKFSKNSAVSKYEQYKYNIQMGRSDLNTQHNG